MVSVNSKSRNLLQNRPRLVWAHNSIFLFACLSGNKKTKTHTPFWIKTHSLWLFKDSEKKAAYEHYCKINDGWSFWKCNEMYGWADLVRCISRECMKAFQSPRSQGKAAKFLEHVQFLPKTEKHNFKIFFKKNSQFSLYS